MTTTPTKPPKQPQDHKPKKKAGAKADAVPDGTVTFEWDGEEWTFVAKDAYSLEFLAALEDAESMDDPGGMIRACRILLGREQAARLFRGRTVDALHDFFTVAGEAAETGNR